MQRNLGTSPVYAIDASSLIAVREQYPDQEDRIFDFLVSLIEEDRLKTVAFVLDELKDPDLRARFRPLRKRFVVPNRVLAPRVGSIGYRFTFLVGINTEKDRADPWLVTLAHIFGYTMVTNEKLVRRRNRKIPRACANLRIPCISLDELLAQEGCPLE